MEHLSDDEVDAYVAGRLPEARERHAELHYLECPACLARVTALQDLAHGLRAVPRPRAGVPFGVAAVAAVLALLAFGLMGRVRTAVPPPREAVSPTPAAPASGLPRFSLRVPERGSALQRLELPRDPALWLAIEAREAGPPGSLFEVTLRDPAGRETLRARALPSDADGRVLLPVSSVVLRPGTWMVEVAARDTLKIPFEVAPPR